ncbi:MAG: GH1 family beta-glucosidase [Thermoanaerobaculia bacterium]|nr:GH1 family beta-glucosidase [Thermoanaerobaculia bacterium]
MTTHHTFPPDFLWGAATAAYQIEGSPLADGAGPSIWHRFSHTPGLVKNGDNGDVACDHYRRWKGDIALMRELGLGAYRFSVAWGRVFPDGAGAVNQKGLDFYRALVDQLLEAGIEPMATLYHWDLPAALDDRGGWLNRDVASWFSDYAQTMARALGDRVAMWVTINEPWVIATGGYLHGGLAPGHRNRFEGPIATHNILRAHGAGVRACRAETKAPVGIVLNLEPKYPASDGEADVAATRRADAFMNRQYLDPLFRGAYPVEMPELFGEAWPSHPVSDFDLITTPIDFLGVNYYSRGLTKDDPGVAIERASRVRNPSAAYTEMGWEVFPQGLSDILVRVADEYTNVPLYVTENGAAFYDPPVALAEGVDDPLRVAYLREHLLAVRDAITRGAEVRGYFAWSLMDNFEWSEGYARRFGIVHVDYATQTRTVKRSGRWYADVIRSNGVSTN